MSDWYNPFSWFQAPTTYGGYSPPQRSTSMWSDPMAWLGLGGTGMGLWSSWQNNNRMSDYYDYQRNRASAYDKQLQSYYTNMNAFNAQRMAAMQGLMGQAMGAMSAPIQSSYGPMSDAAAKALRRGVTAQSALRTGGNEGGYIDAQVGEGMEKSENSRYEAATRLDAMLNQNRLSMWPALLQAMASAFGSGPVAPIASLGVQPPNFGNMGSVDAFGNYMKWKAQQDALNAERISNQEFYKRTPWSPGPSTVPSVYEPPMYDYEGPY